MKTKTYVNENVTCSSSLKERSQSVPSLHPPHLSQLPQRSLPPQLPCPGPSPVRVCPWVPPETALPLCGLSVSESTGGLCLWRLWSSQDPESVSLWGGWLAQHGPSQGSRPPPQGCRVSYLHPVSPQTPSLWPPWPMCGLWERQRRPRWPLSWLWSLNNTICLCLVPWLTGWIPAPAGTPSSEASSPQPSTRLWGPRRTHHVKPHCSLRLQLVTSSPHKQRTRIFGRYCSPHSSSCGGLGKGHLGPLVICSIPLCKTIILLFHF